jgi:hypothetical protein
MGDGAGQFHTRRWPLVMASAHGPNQFVSLALCDALVARTTAEAVIQYLGQPTALGKRKVRGRLADSRTMK